MTFHEGEEEALWAPGPSLGLVVILRVEERREEEETSLGLVMLRKKGGEWGPLLASL